MTALKAIFEDKFKYYTKVVDLSNKCCCPQRCECSPQDRFDRELKRFMNKYDGEHNLTILYYTGHGTYIHENEGVPGYYRLHE